jgi:hypothetical protein
MKKTTWLEMGGWLCCPFELDSCGDRGVGGEDHSDQHLQRGNQGHTFEQISFRIDRIQVFFRSLQISKRRRDEYD